MSALPHRALILAGGLGTRLRSVIDDRPKVLAPVGDETFCDRLIEFLVGQGFGELVFLLGYRAEMVIAHVDGRRARRWPSIRFAYSVETAPLGTGGALKLAESFCDAPFFLLNGDTYFEFSAASLIRSHGRQARLCTLAACRVDDAGRYGALELAEDGRVVAFREKDPGTGAGVINGGIYLMEPALLAEIPSGRALSLESELFPALVARRQLGAEIQDGVFIDIGTPESYNEFMTRAPSGALGES
ncbi:MAG: nucleotidyltransferase family protein [Myxococcales bacterium]|nr:nucleotidyltransferase family protein [Myxococcales bacterium]